MEVFDIFINGQRYAVYPDEWESGIQQVKAAEGNSRFLRMKACGVWEELDSSTLSPKRIADHEQVQLIGRQIEIKLSAETSEDILADAV